MIAQQRERGLYVRYVVSMEESHERRRLDGTVREEFRLRRKSAKIGTLHRDRLEKTRSSSSLVFFWLLGRALAVHFGGKSRQCALFEEFRRLSGLVN